jgi:hypothetical protein
MENSKNQKSNNGSDSKYLPIEKHLPDFLTL